MKRSSNFVAVTQDKNSHEVEVLRNIVREANSEFKKEGFSNRLRVSVKGRLGKDSEFGKFYGYKNWRIRYEELNSGEFVPSHRDIVTQMIDEGYRSSYQSVPHPHASRFDLYIHTQDPIWSATSTTLSYEKVEEIIENLKAKYKEITF